MSSLFAVDMKFCAFMGMKLAQDFKHIFAEKVLLYFCSWASSDYLDVMSAVVCYLELPWAKARSVQMGWIRRCGALPWACKRARFDGPVQTWPLCLCGMGVWGAPFLACIWHSKLLDIFKTPPTQTLHPSWIYSVTISCLFLWPWRLPATIHYYKGPPHAK